MIKKKKIIIPILLTTIFVGINKVDAYTFGVGYADTGGHVEVTPREDYVHQETEISGNARYTHTCTYNYSISVNKNITINGYDLQDNEIMRHSLTIAEDNKILAGTSIGLNVFETKKISWEVTKAEATYVEERKYKLFRCTYKDNAPAQMISNRLNIDTSLNKYNVQSIANKCSRKDKPYYGYYYYSEPKCPAFENCEVDSGPTRLGNAETYYVEGSGNDTAQRQKECEEKAANAAIAAANNYFYSSYELKMTDSNDVNGSETVNITNEDANKTKEYYKNGTKINCTNDNCKFKYEEVEGQVPKSDSREVKFYYKKNNVCINVKNSKITYRDDKCNSDEIKIENTKIGDLEHWHYFVPLNAKSNSDIIINLLPAYGANLISSECNYVMKNNPVHLDSSNNILTTTTSYLDLIIPKEDGKIFEGNYSYKYQNAGNTINNEESSDFAEITTNGCRLTSKIKIPINQQFYNEKTTTSGGTTKITFNGFNFYYRPINTENPFPNEISTNSLWKDWNKTTNNNPDISNSYKEVTYIAANINANAIRKYTKNNPYTSWSNMNIDGTSKFIDNEGIVVRNTSGYNGYKLGCGPANEDEYLDAARTKKNNLYIKGCDT